jgi:hypothetical protein
LRRSAMLLRDLFKKGHYANTLNTAFTAFRCCRRRGINHEPPPFIQYKP